MARQQQQNAQKTFGETQNVYNQDSGNASALYNSLFPQFTAEATNPQGFTPGETASMNTAAQQSVGGATAGAVGQGTLRAARTRNSGGSNMALDDAVRSGQQTLSQDALGVQNENAMLKESQRQAGLSGLSSLYGTNQSGMLSALGLGNQATQTGTQAGQSGWFQNMTSLIAALKPGGSTANGGSVGFGGG